MLKFVYVFNQSIFDYLYDIAAKDTKTDWLTSNGFCDFFGVSVGGVINNYALHFQTSALLLLRKFPTQFLPNPN
ncbi:MAG: hypothetical protein WBE46_02085 [Dehalococcoidia bacterium]